MSNQKYEITDVAHEKYPFLHCIRALQDVRPDVKAGDLGGFVESESNLSFEPGDTAWIYGDAIAAGSACVDKGSVLRDQAVICDCAYVSEGSVLCGHARAEDNAYIRNSVMKEHARASGNAMIIDSTDTHKTPEIAGNSVVYGKVVGLVQISGEAVLFDTEEISNPSLDTFILSDQGRSIIRDPSRDELSPLPQKGERETGHKRGRGMSR